RWSAARRATGSRGHAAETARRVSFARPYGSGGQVAGAAVFGCAVNLSTWSFAVGSLLAFAGAAAHQVAPLPSCRRTAIPPCDASFSVEPQLALPARTLI